MALHSHLTSENFYANNLALIKNMQSSEPGGEGSKKHRFAMSLLERQYGSLNEFPLLSNVHLNEARLNGKDLTLKITLCDTEHRAKQIETRYSFAVDLAEHVLDKPGFAETLATLIGMNLAIPLSMLRLSGNDTFLSILQHESVLDMDSFVGSLSPAEVRLCSVIKHQFTHNQALLKAMAFVAWNDRMKVYRVVQEWEGSRHLARQINPRYVMEFPGAGNGFDTRQPDLAENRALVSFSWGKESLLSAKIAEELCPNVVYGSIQHDYNFAESVDRKGNYQESYDAYRTGTRYENATFINTRIGLLEVIFQTLPALYRVTHAVHHIYALAHMLSAWNDADVILLGDEMERTYSNPLFRLVKTPEREIKDNQGLIHTLDDLKLLHPDEDAVAGADVNRFDKGQVVKVAGYSYRVDGYDHDFDFHQSLHIQVLVNSALAGFTRKRMSSVVYNYPEITIQYVLASIDPELFSYQASCWFTSLEHRWCGECAKCVRLAWIMKALGLDHEAIGLKYKDPLAFFTAKHINGNTLFAVDADPYPASGQPAGPVCDAAVKFMILRCLCDGNLQQGRSLPSELKYDPEQWLIDIEQNLLERDFSAIHVSNPPAQDALVAPHLEKFYALIREHLSEWQEQMRDYHDFTGEI